MRSKYEPHAADPELNYLAMFNKIKEEAKKLAGGTPRMVLGLVLAIAVLTVAIYVVALVKPTWAAKAKQFLTFQLV